MNLIIIFLRKIKQNVECRINLARITKIKNNFVQQLHSSIKETINKKLTADEKEWIEKIEKIRAELSNSKTVINRIDYGAGKSDSNLTQKEMEDGVEVSSILGELCIKSSKPPFWSFLLFKLILKFNPNICVEMGTCIGISASYQAAALKLNKKGFLYTLEGDKSLASIAKNNFERLGLNNICVIVGRFKDTLVKTLEANKPIDYVFIDGHHDEKATVDYFEQIYPFLSKKALVVFDDISWSRGMKKAWLSIQNDRRISISLDLGPVGICLIDSEYNSPKKHFNTIL